MKRFKYIYIEITNICNLNCSFCTRTVKKKEYMSPTSFRKVIKKIDQYTDYIYLHIQGEPLLHPNLDEILSIIDEYHKKVNIVTNGTLLEKVCPTLIKHRSIRQINISLHSFDKGSIDKHLSSILSVSNILLANNIIIAYRLWNMDNNPYAKEIITKLQNYYNSNTLPKLKENVYLNQDITFNWPLLQNNINEPKGTCYGTRTHLGILVDGTIIPCCLDKDGIIELGNIFKDDFEKVITSKRFIKMNEGFKNQQKIEELCSHCNFINN